MGTGLAAGLAAGQINGLIGLLYGLLALAIVIAILGIINTQALSVIARRREIGMLRAVGMLRAQVRRTIYLESLLIAVFGAALGLGLGLTFGVLFQHTLSGQGLNVLSVPWGQALLFLALGCRRRRARRSVARCEGGTDPSTGGHRRRVTATGSRSIRASVGAEAWIGFTVWG